MSTDLLYYIMDYSGRYYKVDKGDQLVVSSEEEATVFTFAQANSRICVGKKSSFYCMIPIEEETDEACEKQEEGVPEEMEAVFGKEEKSSILEISGWLFVRLIRRLKKFCWKQKLQLHRLPVMILNRFILLKRYRIWLGKRFEDLKRN